MQKPHKNKAIQKIKKQELRLVTIYFSNWQKAK